MGRSRAMERGRTGGRGSTRRSRSRTPRNIVAATLFALALALVVVLGGAQAQTGPPEVDGEGAREVTDTTALLAGYVNPNGGHTTYRFEYGLDPSYGNTTAVDNAGSGATAVPATKAVSGLQPNTTYHFRLVATNAAGETPGADQTFTTPANPPQPSGRVYEMVSPLDKNGGDIDRDRLLVTSGQSLSNQSGASPSGDAAAFTSRLQFAGIESGAIEPTYVARRGPSGWTTEGVTPPIGNVQGSGTERPSVAALSPDLSKAFVRAAARLTPSAETLNGSWGFYMRTSGLPNPYTLLSSPFLPPPADPLPPEINTTNAAGRFEYAASTPDSRHVVFNSSRHLLSGPGIPGDSPSGISANAVYEWVDGTVRLVSVPPDGVTFASGEVVAGAVSHRGGDFPGDHVLSDDGRRVFFSAPVEGVGRHVFMREDGSTSVHVSRSEIPPGGLVPASAAEFWAAKRSDGSVVFFKANVPLTSDAGQGFSLYRRDFAAPAGEPPLTVITKDVDQDAVPPQQAAVVGPAAVNDDATSIAFVANGLLDPDEDDVARGAHNLYLWRQGKGVEYIATLDASLDTKMWGTSLQIGSGGRAARLSADGERLLFTSFAKLDPSYDVLESNPAACGNPNTGGDPCRQIYLYDARSDDLSCLTCVPAVPVTGSANLFGNSQLRPGDPVINSPFRESRNLSADGTRAFFETARPLVSADQNTKIDVYEWEDRDLDGQGELRLISPGRGTSDSKFLDASVSGDDVFLTTREQLVGIDTDNLVDLYDARVGGGIPAQNPPPISPCEGEECQGVFSGPPFLPVLGSGGTSHGDLRSGRRPSFSLARLSRRQQAQLARGRAVMVQVRVSRSGRVRLAARARVGGRMLTVASASNRARRAGAVRLRLQLSPPALRALGRKGRLNVTLAVRFTGVREARTSMLRLRRARSSGERGTR